MLRFAFSILLASIAFSGIQSRADEVPKFDMRKNCKADVDAYQGGGNQQGCLADEQSARDALVSQWMQFEPESRSRCTRMVNSVAGAQSYVELLTCLQMAKDVKGLPTR